MSCNKEKLVLMRVMEMYRDMTYLWQRDHELYMNREMREEGFKVLLEVYKNFDKDAAIKKIKRKIENMRTTYVRELRKVRASKQTASGENQVYVPTLWYYDELSFLDNTIENVEHCRTEPDPSENDNSSEDEAPLIVAKSSSLQKRIKKDPLFQKQENIFLPVETCTTQKVPVEAFMAQKLPVETCLAQIDDEFEAYGRSIGFQMKNLNKRQLTIAQKIISDVLFYAKLDQLSETSYVVRKSSNESGTSHSGLNQRQNQVYSVNMPMPIKSSPPSNYSSPSPSHQT
ncbi:uncharacterized protein LOC126373351 [Pectinophora gossypiella]|uniref:uncharacterized protein LOC126373351 n=1 Tax=Pectinophora gossypiella TaxID=13191 RepID=UPI00214E790D|nr:uncharacterized protein LOC126373351 [Pectinophora gossypiella]